MKKFLEKLGACEEALLWIENRSIEESVKECQRGDWLLWFAKKLDIDLRLLTLAKARCAKTVLHLMKDERSINAVNVAEKFGLGNATREDLDAAAYSAYAAARIKNQKETSEICREILGEEIVKILNQKLNIY